MSETAWQAAHRAEVTARLTPLRSRPDGTLEEIQTPLHRIRLVKQGEQICFFFVDPHSGALDGPMSRMALGAPLTLLSEYTQAALLALLWQPEPARICMLGVAGGRLSLLLYHAFPAARIQNVDIDPATERIAREYFGVTFDERQTLAIDDARAFLARDSGEPYAIIVMDAFRDESDNLDNLATREFYGRCRARLAPDGVLVANMLASDALILEKLRTFRAAFPQVVVYPHRHGYVLFGSRRARPVGERAVRQAALLERRHGFGFPLAERAAALRPFRALEARLAGLGDAPLLTDDGIGL